MLYIRLKIPCSSHVLTKFMDAQRRTTQIFVTQGVGCASCMCDWGIIPWPKFGVFVLFEQIMIFRNLDVYFLMTASSIKTARN